MVSFIDEGPGTEGSQLWMEDENYATPNGGAWTQFGAWEREGYDNYMIYWWDYDKELTLGDIEGVSWGWVDTGVPRSAGEHTLLLGMQSDGTVDYWLDGCLVLTTTAITPNYFGDIYLAGHSDPSNPSATVVFTYYNTGTDYDDVLTQKYYGDVTLSGGFQASHFCNVWDLTASDLVIQFTYDGTGLVDDTGAHAWAELGVREVGYGDFNPTYGVEGAGVWLATDYEWVVDTFDPDPVGAPNLDLDDKLILQKAGGNGEGDYNLPSIPPNPWANHAVWFDRDGVDQYQAALWGAIDGVTYNTAGTYDIVITLHATSDTAAEAYMTVNGEPQGFYDPDWHTGPADLSPAGMTFTGDMSRMQVFYGLYGYGASHTISFNDIIVTGKQINIAFDDASDSITPINTAANVLAKLTNAAGDPVEEIDVTFSSDRPGLTFTPTSGTTDVNGEIASTVEANAPGIYTITASVCGCLSDTWTLVAYDPSGGFVTGGGWIDSPEEAYKPDPLLTGKAIFGFVSKYKKGAITPTGETEFVFKTADLNFHSDSYDWLVIAGKKAIYKGVGTINGGGSYKFLLSAIDGDLRNGDGIDKFRIKIWTEDAFDVETVIYDNQVLGDSDEDAEPTTNVQGGNIKVHKG
jgi:hypothetical protein